MFENIAHFLHINHRDNAQICIWQVTYIERKIMFLPRYFIIIALYFVIIALVNTGLIFKID